MCLNFFKINFFILALGFSGMVTACPSFYFGAKAGVFHGYFSNEYTDLTDVIQQNISEDVTQFGYEGGIALGYVTDFKGQYTLGAELSGNLYSNQAEYQAGAATAAFTDQMQINGNIDAAFLPGIKLSQSMIAYLKLGASLAWIHDGLTSPVGFTPTITNYSTNKTVFGGVLGLGVRKNILKNIFLFVESTYHDYGTVNFSNFQNFSASYSHSARVHAFDVAFGAAYQV